MNLRKSILALSVVAGIVAAPMTVFAAHTHSWGSPQYYGYEDESNISKTNGEELVNINSELLGSTPFDIQIDKTALQTRKETETEVTIKTNLTDWGYTVSSEKGKISDINKNSFIYIAPKDERDDTIKIQLSDYENGISYEYTIPLIFAGNNEHSLDKFKENLSRLPNS